MDQTAPRRTPPWLAFLAGAVAMLALALGWSAWRKHDEAVDGVRLAAGAAAVLPAAPRIPEAPRLPDAPIPRPM